MGGSRVVVLRLGTWNWTLTRTAIVNELGLGRTRVDSDLDILDAEIFQSTDESMSCVI